MTLRTIWVLMVMSILLSASPSFATPGHVSVIAAYDCLAAGDGCTRRTY